MSRVYGDSTPFPHDIDYIHLLRDGTDCAVRLLSAQHSIRAAMERTQTSERAREGEMQQLNALFESVQNAATRFLSEGFDRSVRTAAQIVAGARAVVDGAVSDLEAQVAGEMSQARTIMEKARETTQSAIEHYLERHTPPGTRSSVQLVANSETNAGQVTLTTPFRVSTTFGVALPPHHAWARPRRVADFAPQLEIHMPKESGWLSKRVERAPVRLDRLFISELTHGESSGALGLRRGAASGSGYHMRVEVQDGVMSATIRPLREDGTPDAAQPLPLEGKDLSAMLALWQSAAESCRDLLGLRRRLISATFADQPLLELESPRLLAEALIADMAPIVVEISRRSGAPGELVLRRNLGEGRREETYCTHAELLEKISVLPPDLRGVFSAFHLAEQAGALHGAMESLQTALGAQPPAVLPPLVSSPPASVGPFAGSRPPPPSVRAAAGLKPPSRPEPPPLVESGSDLEPERSPSVPPAEEVAIIT